MEATDDTALNSLNLKLSELVIRNEITTPIRHEISKVLALNRQLLAKHAILKQRFKDIEKIVCERSERKDGAALFGLGLFVPDRNKYIYYWTYLTCNFISRNRRLDSIC